MTAPLSAAEAEEYTRNSIRSSDMRLPFVGSMDLVRPGCVHYDSDFETSLGSLLKDEPVGTYLMSISSP